MAWEPGPPEARALASWAGPGLLTGFRALPLHSTHSRGPGLPLEQLGTACPPHPRFFIGRSCQDSTADQEQRSLEKATKERGARATSQTCSRHLTRAPGLRTLIDNQGGPRFHAHSVGAFKDSPGRPTQGFPPEVEVSAPPGSLWCLLPLPLADITKGAPLPPPRCVLWLLGSLCELVKRVTNCAPLAQSKGFLPEPETGSAVQVAQIAMGSEAPGSQIKNSLGKNHVLLKSFLSFFYLSSGAGLWNKLRLQNQEAQSYHLTLELLWASVPSALKWC